MLLAAYLYVPIVLMATQVGVVTHRLEYNNIFGILDIRRLVDRRSFTSSMLRDPVSALLMAGSWKLDKRGRRLAASRKCGVEAYCTQNMTPCIAGEIWCE